jgi:sugar phosphate isomerase/epimerase
MVPFEGSIDWPACMTALQKVGYEGAVILEIAAAGSAFKETLGRAARARNRLDALLADSWSDQEQWM